MRYEHYDKLETRDPEDRDRDFFGRLPNLIALALSGSGWARQLAGVDPNAVTSRAALEQLPVLRKSNLLALQKQDPPFGGFNVTAPGKVRRLLMSPGPIFEPEGAGKDWWGAARALFAAGFRAGDVVHNSLSYHLTPGGFMMESGAFQARRLYRHPGFPQDPARCGGESRQGRRLAQARSRLRRGAARFTAAGIGRTRRQGAAMLRHRRARRHRL